MTGRHDALARHDRAVVTARHDSSDTLSHPDATVCHCYGAIVTACQDIRCHDASTIWGGLTVMVLTGPLLHPFERGRKKSL